MPEPAGPFRPSTATFRGKVHVAAAPGEAFPLFSPEGERRWVPGWNPSILHPPEGHWEAGQIFTTQEETGEAVWVISRLDRRAHEAEYHRIEPGRYVARVEVACRPAPEGGTEAAIAYSFTGLSDSGNREIEAMTPEAYEAKLARWTEWIARSLDAS
ncbi:MAG TPA: hypothetical protein VNI57_11915 [Candidatus Saccharimonadales bacterium]|nr:hypothetical protein [Candidatus Saccharimonadales bacterium]